MGKVTEQEEGMVFCQASGVRKIPQLRADTLHCCSCWYFLPVEDECYAGTAVVQMPTVWLALGGHLWRRGSGHGANPPLMAWGGEAGEVAVFQTLLSSWASLSLILAWCLEPAGATTTQHLCTVHFAVDTLAAVALFVPAAAMGEL